MTWMQSHRGHFSHSAQILQSCYQSLGRFVSSVYSKAILFVFNVTCDIWLGFSALYVSHCAEMNESFFQISYRDALSETIETPLRPLNWSPDYLCSHQTIGLFVWTAMKRVLSLDSKEILLMLLGITQIAFFMNWDFSIYLFRIPQILKVTETTASTRLASALLHLSVGFSRNHT